MNTWQRLKRDPALWKRYYIRENVLSGIRKYFSARQFHEVETPLLISNPPAESYLEIFETTLLDRNRNPRKAYLSTSPEVSLKKLLVAGIGNCFALTKSFRNMETQSNLHNPEFTILEWYRVGVNYIEIMNDCEELLRSIAGKKSITYQGNTVDVSHPWERLTVTEAFKKYARIDFDEFIDSAIPIALKKGYVTTNATWEELFNQIFLNEVEPHLGRGKPTILYDFPAAMGALAQKKKSDPRFCERFEFYIEGLELGDCYSELTNWKEQQERFEQEMKEIQRLGKTSYDFDRDFIDALKVGLPECSGIAIGVDRLVMLFADVKNINDTLLFPGDEMFR